jgi:hypothetical protein
MHVLRSLGQKGLQDQNTDVIHQGKVGFRRVQVHVISKSAKIMLIDKKWTNSSSDSESSLSSLKASEAKQFTPSLGPPEALNCIH